MAPCDDELYQSAIEERRQARGERAVRTQFPMMVAMVALCADMFLDVCKYVGYKS
jgi:hypothetical protein